MATVPNKDTEVAARDQHIPSPEEERHDEQMAKLTIIADNTEPA